MHHAPTTLFRRLHLLCTAAVLGTAAMTGPAQAQSNMVLHVSPGNDTDPAYTVTVGNPTIPAFSQEESQSGECWIGVNMAEGQDTAFEIDDQCEWITQTINTWTFQVDDRLLNPIQFNLSFLYSTEKQAVIVGVPESLLSDPDQLLPARFLVRSNARIKHRVTPKYTAQAKAVGVEGTCAIQGSIDERGRVYAAKVHECPTLLQDAALNAFRKTRFRPLQIGDMERKSAFTMTYHFKLK